MRIATIEIFIPSPEQADNYTTDQLTVLYAHYGLLAERISEEGYPVPKDLGTSIKVLKREIDHKLAADRERQLETLKARRAALSSVQEKRDQLDAEILQLEATINPPVKAASGN